MAKPAWPPTRNFSALANRHASAHCLRSVSFPSCIAMTNSVGCRHEVLGRRRAGRHDRAAAAESAKVLIGQIELVAHHFLQLGLLFGCQHVEHFFAGLQLQLANLGLQFFLHLGLFAFPVFHVAHRSG